MMVSGVAAEIGRQQCKEVSKSMKTFAVLLLFGLGLSLFTMAGHRYATLSREVWAAVTIALGVGLAWLADLNMFRLWQLHVREPWIGVTLTGLALAGVAYFWHEVLGFFGGLERKYNDEAAALEKSQDLRRVA
jgi:hypothetical protein